MMMIYFLDPDFEIYKIIGKKYKNLELITSVEIINKV